MRYFFPHTNDQGKKKLDSLPLFSVVLPNEVKSDSVIDSISNKIIFPFWHVDFFAQLLHLTMGIGMNEDNILSRLGDPTMGNSIDFLKYNFLKFTYNFIIKSFCISHFYHSKMTPKYEPKCGIKLYIICTKVASILYQNVKHNYTLFT